jgi:dihydroorotate dehydrogenase
MNLEAPGNVGLAAGLDKDARAFPALRALGFDWIEVGTVTPRPQPGNTRPRLFRLEADHALINRMGFNSCGLERFVANLSAGRPRYDSVLGINIGKNADTPIESAEQDYLLGFEKVYPHADYVAVNISSPNTQSLRDLQHADRLGSLVDALVDKRRTLRDRHGHSVPIAIKLSPDLPDGVLQSTGELLSNLGVDGVIATNTTTTRPSGLTSRDRKETGGLSGAPLEAMSTRVVAALREHLREDIPVIGVGGVEDAAGMSRKLAAGARAVQCYTAFIYQGPRLLQRLHDFEPYPVVPGSYCQ